jgi:hypothetical protein
MERDQSASVGQWPWLRGTRQRSLSRKDHVFQGGRGYNHVLEEEDYIWPDSAPKHGKCNDPEPIYVEVTSQELESAKIPAISRFGRKMLFCERRGRVKNDMKVCLENFLSVLHHHHHGV